MIASALGGRPLTVQGIPTAASLRSVFPMVNEARLAGVKKTLGKRPLLKIGASATALFDHGFDFRGVKDLDAFRAYMRAHENEPMPLRLGSEVITSLLDLNYLSKDHQPLVILEIHTRMGDDCTERLIHSLKACGFEAHINNDFIPVSQYTPRDPEDTSTLVQHVLRSGLDFFFSSSEDIAAKLNLAGVGAGLFYPNPDVTPFNPLKQRQYLTDGDGAFWSDHFEREFQRVYAEEKAAGGNPSEIIVRAKEKWYAYVEGQGRNNMSAGPVMALFQGLSRLAGLFDQEEGKINPLLLGLVTTRDQRGGIAVADFLSSFGVHLDEKHYMSGNPKNPRLIDALAFFEDDPKHLERAVKELTPDKRPKGLIWVPHGVKYEKMRSGQEVVSDGEGTAQQ